MVLGFKPQFVPKILSGQKIHTIREDKHNRWKPGMNIHMATGVRTKKYECFKYDRCESVQEIVFHYYRKTCRPHVRIDGRLLYPEEVMRLARNDGFDSLADFFAWFNNDYRGKIIHWTYTKY